MENSQFEIYHNGYLLYFDGCELINARHEENPSQVSFGDDWFVDESGERIEIEVHEDQPHPYDNGNRTLYARIFIEGRQVKKLEIFEYPNGTLYIEPQEDY